MIIESNRLHHKIKRLKEELTKEKELRKEAERQLKMLEESMSTSTTTAKQQQCDITVPTNIGLLVVAAPLPADFSIEENTPRRVVPVEMSNEEKELEMVCCRKSEEMVSFFATLPKMIEEQRTLEMEAFYKDFRRTSSLNWNEIKRNVAPKNHLFLMLCQELFHRQYKTVNRDQESEEAWRSYQELLTTLPSHLFLPDEWVFDIIKEFAYRFQKESTSSARHSGWTKDSMIETLTSLFSNQSLLKLHQFLFIGLLQLHTFSENHSAIIETLKSFELKEMEAQDLDLNVNIKINYEIGFAYLVTGKSLDATDLFLDILAQLKNISIDDKIVSEYTYKIQRCLAFCVSSNSKIQRKIPKCTMAKIENLFKLEIEEWKDGKVETLWNFFSDCSPYIRKRDHSSPECKTVNLKNIKSCLRIMTTWKPLRNLKGLLKICDILLLDVVPKSIVPVTTESDIIFFCDNNNGLLRLVNSKSSRIENVLQEFPNIHKRETLTFLIMQYHKILRKQRSEEKVLAFGRKFVNVLKAIGYVGKINVEDAMCYIREVSKISMEAANKLVEDQCKL